MDEISRDLASTVPWRLFSLRYPGKVALKAGYLSRRRKGEGEELWEKEI